MKVDLNKSLVNLDGTEIENANIGKMLANELSTAKEGDALKQWSWAKKLYSGEELDLDPSDGEMFKTFVKSSSFPVITKAQILENIKD